MASVRKRIWKTATGEKRESWTVDFNDTQGKRQRKNFPTRKEAVDFRVETEGSIRSGTFRPEAAKTTIADAGVLFLAYCERRKERGEKMTRQNYEVYAGHIRNYISPDPKHIEEKRRYRERVDFSHGIGGIVLGLLTARAVGDFRDHLRDHGLSVTTTRKVLTTLKLILNYAISRDLLAHNVATTVKVIGRRGEGAKKIYPPSKEVMKRLLAVADENFRVRLLFAATSGLRAGEFHAVRWRHIDFQLGEVTVETRVDHYGVEDVTKTDAGMRTVPLGALMIDELKAWRERSKRKDADDLVFPNKRGWYENHDNMVKRRFNPLFDELAKLHAEDPKKYPPAPKRFNWHALRHFTVSCWIDAGLPPKTIQTFAGHATLAITMDRYGHLFKSELHKSAMDQIAGQFAVAKPDRPQIATNAKKGAEFIP